ncbi:helix-turn-helix domain-containing protein [Variovorax ureilyticus]|uniref:Helix-turn-helix domain-containing protein n=1 Tax=Variovorax ureilyticus TaxID=1836198 RepID=A0ABU8VJA7_9BURK
MSTSVATAQRITGENLTPKQTAELLNVPETTLAVWRSTNRVVVPYFKLGSHVRYRRSDLDRFIESQLRNLPDGGDAR